MIVVIGKSGQLAQELKATGTHREVTFLGREDIDLFDRDKLFGTLSEYKPQIIINASAYTAVDKAESDEAAAFKLNCEAVESLAQYCSLYECRLVHVSTDFVFDGSKNQPYEVDDNTNPLGVYGASKLAGDEAIQEVMQNGYAIIRTSWLYSCFGANFVKTMIKLMNERSDLGIVSDQIGCPTYARGLAEFIWQLVDSKEFNGIYHWSDLGVASWYDFAVEIYRQGKELGIIRNTVTLNAITTNDYPTPAKRPKYSLLKADSRSRTQWQDNLHDMMVNIERN
ncbi:dTDP-4-dehydrorhamnose reductase [Pseudoalteromonas sp. SSDWG2]|uniref:dTDP-4-dehydrorhamnose reductase n=1 Tax=Pseudoalteromonas sp. SSDWG2 TaxID=3139391 RepID=UPI003BA991DD